jgi:hypothetical protein
LKILDTGYSILDDGCNCEASSLLLDCAQDAEKEYRILHRGTFGVKVQAIRLIPLKDGGSSIFIIYSVKRRRIPPMADL